MTFGLLNSHRNLKIQNVFLTTPIWEFIQMGVHKKVSYSAGIA